MTRPLRTNPVYAALAYEKTLTRYISVSLRRKFLGDELTHPKEILVCEEVFPADSQVPQEAVQRYLEKLTEEEAELDLQMRRFELTQTKHNDQEPKRQKGPGKHHPKGGQGNRQGGRTH